MVEIKISYLLRLSNDTSYLTPVVVSTNSVFWLQIKKGITISYILNMSTDYKLNQTVAVYLRVTFYKALVRVKLA